MDAQVAVDFPRHQSQIHPISLIGFLHNHTIQRPVQRRNLRYNLARASDTMGILSAVAPV